MKVINRSNLPISLPIWQMLISRIALDHYGFSPGWYFAWWWGWGSVCAIVLLVAMFQKQTDIFKGGWWHP